MKHFTIKIKILITHFPYVVNLTLFFGKYMVAVFQANYFIKGCMLFNFVLFFIFFSYLLLVSLIKRTKEGKCLLIVVQKAKIYVLLLFGKSFKMSYPKIKQVQCK